MLWFEDQTVVQGLQAGFPLYADQFPIWSEHSSGMTQYVAWTALEAEGFGANLQHYSNLVEKQVQETWNVPATWSLKSQLIFGTAVGGAGDKTFAPLEDRVKVYGA